MRIGKRSSGGFAYVLLLLAVALIGLSSSAAIDLGSAVARRDAEQHLLTVGLEFQSALFSYATAASASTGHGPKSLDELLRDPRAPNVVRHLRRVYEDPLTGRAEWQVVRDSQGFIIGLHSLSTAKPIKRSGFEPRLVGFEDAGSYKEWVFGLPGAVKVRTPRAAP